MINERALFANGIYEDVLEEIIKAQSNSLIMFITISYSKIHKNIFHLF
jgi:hypothetical protein